MNSLIQNILVIAALGLAVLFLFKKFFWKNKNSQKNCGGDENCGCH